MKNTLLLLLLSLFFTAELSAQQAIDGTFAFQNDPAKKYSLYIPSGYEAGTPNRLMLGLHPLNTNRWDAQSWRDTLTAFAESNQLLLVCPDGGADGRVDDPIDTAFTTALLDSMLQWYNVDEDKIYAMGFSWGGRTTYTYGLSHVGRFGGFIPIGAAITGTTQVDNLIAAAEGQPFYIVHGSQDNLPVRFTPIRSALQNNNAILNFEILDGVGHTIDFPNRNQILTTAYEWVDSVNCSRISTATFEVIEGKELGLSVFPNPVKAGQIVQFNAKAEVLSQQWQAQWLNPKGQVLMEQAVKGLSGIQVPEAKGLYWLRLRNRKYDTILKIIVL